jgi:exosortase
MAQDWKQTLLGLGVGCFLTVLILWPTLQSLTQVWRSNQAYQFAWLVLPLIVYLLGWHNRPGTLLIRPQPDLSGVAVASIAAVGWIASDLMNIDAGRQFSFILAIQGVCMAALGWRAYWRLSPTLLLMFFMVPSGDFLQPILRHLTVKIIELFATAIGLPHQVDGFQIAIGESDYVVLNECAGLPYFLLATFLGYAFGLMLYRSIYKILALALFGAFIGILSNALRVWAIVWIDWVQKSQMPLTAHGNIQWVALLICLGLLFFVLGKLDEEKNTNNKDIAMPTSDSQSRQWAPVLAGFSVFVISGGAGWMLSNTSSTQNASPPISAPPSVSGWELTTPLATWLDNPRNNTRSLLVNYRRGGETLRVRVVETMTAEAKLQESEVAPGETNTWHQNSIQIKAACGTSECIQLLHTIWENGKTEERQHVYSTYALGGHYTTSKFVLRARYGWVRLTGGLDKPRLIAVMCDAPIPSERNNELSVLFRSFRSEVVDQ